MLFIYLKLEELELMSAPNAPGVIHFYVLKVRLKAITDYEGHTFLGVDDLVIFLS